ncbi:MAG: gliding motility-associated C-terminal domain-containing protein [Flavobacteriales bacterium]
MARSLRAFLVCTSFCLMAAAMGQTLVLNEVSNGPAGSQEYMEFAVVPNGPVDPCTPICMDLRGWIIDDNNGYHGNDGIAVGALRFSTTATLWSCVPVGTVIVIYNGSDRNPALPANDVSLTDGNCTIVTPASSPLFESTNATPQPVQCSNPGGWGAPVTWACVGLRNQGDCARITDPSGCEVFSLGYGDNTQNNTIYFAGNGQRRVYFHNGGDPAVQGNWSAGCAAPGQCGSEEQTPGAPNNAANAAWLAQFNGNCAHVTPPDPLVVTATATNTCACTGTALASATGSVPGYGFVWYDQAWAAIGQNTANAGGLCAGTYHVIGTSSTGCADTATVTIGQLAGPAVTLHSIAAACGSPTGRACATVSGGTGTITFLWNDAAAQATACATGLAPNDYTVTATDANGCRAIGTITVGDSLPNVSISITTDAAACGSATGRACATVVNGGTATWILRWNDPAAQTADCATGLAPDAYTVTATDANGCTASATATVGNDVPAITVDEVVDASCAGLADGRIALGLPDNTHTLSWSGPDGFSASLALIDGLAPGQYTYIWAGGTPCEHTGAIDITAPPAIGLAASATAASCHLQCDGRIDLTLTDGVAPFQYTLDNVPQATEPFTTVCPGPHTVAVTDARGCAANTTVEVDDGPPGPNVDITPLDPLCVAAPVADLIATGPSGTWSGPGIADGTIGRFDPALAGPGDHWVVYRSNGACSNADSIQVHVSPMPVAGFRTDPGTPSELDTQVLLINTSTDASTFTWTLDDRLLASTANAVLPLDDRTDYPVCLIASGLPFCADTTCRIISLITPLQVFVPNTFTPEGDAINDVFAPVFSTPPAACTLTIFDRWGGQLFHANAYKEAHWDGGGAKSDVYVWRLTYRDPATLDNFERIGHVTLLR